ncbi:MAG: TetR/AcrR family transcriptional regulator [Firmicutes bacterium]|nr:TetR/AcrR family transcriptional regulator [Bacillota bacterium]
MPPAANTIVLITKIGVIIIESNTKNVKDLNESVGNRKEQIIATAVELFSENGYDNTPIRLLANKTELSVAGLYYFFKDKEEILFSIIISSLKKFNDTLSAVCKGGDPQCNLRLMLKNLLKHVIEHKKEISIVVQENKRLNPEQLKAIRIEKRRAYDFVKGELIKLKKLGRLKSANLAPAVYSFFSMIFWCLRWYKPEGALTVEEVATELANIYFLGILKE